MGNYESTRFDIQAELEDWEDPEQSIQLLKQKLTSIAKVELSNGYSSVLSKLNLEQKYISEIKTLARDIEAKQDELRELKAQLKALETLCSEANKLLKTYSEFNQKDSALKELKSIVYSYNALTKEVERVESKTEGSEF